MRPLLHVVSVLLMLPYLLLASLFLLIGRLAASRGLFGVLGTLIDEFIWLVPWGVLGFVATVLVLIGLGFSTRTLWLAGLCVGLLGTGTLLVLLLFPEGGLQEGQWLFLLPCVVSLGLGFWICLAERGAVQSVPP